MQNKINILPLNYFKRQLNSKHYYFDTQIFMKKVKNLFIVIIALTISTNASAQAIGDKFQVDSLFYEITNVETAEVKIVSKYKNGWYGDTRPTGDVVIPISINHYDKEYTVTAIGDYTFIDCIELTSIVIPNSVTTIGKEAFRGCFALTSITLSDSVTAIGDWAFSSCVGLTSIKIPNSVTTIGEYAFYGCIGLTAITIPNSVTTIENDAFCACESLTAIYVESGNTSYSSQDGILFSYDKTSIIRFPIGKNATSYSLPNSVTTIGAAAFSGCSELTAITIPSSVTSIGFAAFTRCSGLTSIEIPNSVITIEGSAFSGCTGLTSITISNSVTKISGSSFSGCSGLTSIIIPDSVTSIDWYAFQNCTGLTSVTIPNSVKVIKSGAFSGCSGLKTISIPNSVTTIDYAAFENCIGLTSITIPDSNIRVGYYAFSGCTGLTSITIPNSVIAIGDFAFSGCTGLTAIYCHVVNPASITSFGKYVFYKVKTDNCTLYVPIGSKEKYAVAEQWKIFVNIEEKEFETGLKSLTEQGFHIWGGKGQIHINYVDFNQTQPAVVYVYNISGALVRSVKTKHESSLQIPIETGTYIIRIGNAAEKVIVQ